ncbi:MAG TPA: hypothetical protein VHC19_03300, partial [Pirellulales bacterium]|nr:hypothetical protein [Pirellulales bacterium]
MPRFLRPLNSRTFLSASKFLSGDRGVKRTTKKRRAAIDVRNAEFEFLEQRAMLDAMAWVGGSGNWNDSSHWQDNTTPDNHAVPMPGDVVTIDTGGAAATITVQAGDNINIASLTTAANDALSITGGELTVTSGSSALSGPLNMSGGSLAAAGAGVALTANGATSLSGGALLTYSAGVLNLPTVTSYTAPSTGSRIEAANPGSQINLPNLTTLNGAFNGNSLYVHSYGGASIDMHQLPQVTSGAVRFRTENSGSSLDLSALTTFNATSSGAILESDSGATLDIGNLTTLDNVALTVGGAASVSQITTVTNGSIGARDGATATFSGLTTFTSDGFFAYAAGVLNLPTVASYTAPSTGSRFEAGDADSQINLPNLTTFNGAFNGNTAYVHVYGGASIDMHQLPQVTSGAVRFRGENSGSSLDLSALTTFNATSSGATLESDSGAALSIGSLTSLDKVAVIIGGTASVSQIASVTNGSLEAHDGATATFSGLTTFTADSFYAYSAGVLNLPTVASFTAPSTGSKFESGDSGSQINLANLTTLNGAFNSNTAYVHVYGGASIDMHQLPQINSGAVRFLAQGSGSTLDLSALTTFTATSTGAGLESDNGASLDIGNLTSLDKVALTIGGAASLAQIASVTNGSLAARDGATATFSGLTTFTADSFYVYTAGILNLPTITSYAGSSTFTPSIQAGDSGSQINLANLTTLNGGTNGNRIYVHAYGGASIDMHQLPQINSGAVYFQAQGSGSTIDLSALTAFSATSTGASLESDTGATLDIGNLATLDNVALIIGGSASISQITSVTNGSITAHDGATATFSGLTTFTGDSFYANSAGILNLPTVASYTGPSSFSPIIQAGDSGSRINLSNLTTLNGATNGYRIFVHAYGGASIDMHQLPQITSGAVYFQAQNSGSTIDLSALTTFTATSSNAALESDTGATLDIADLTTLDNVALIIGGAASVSQIASVTHGSITAHDGATPTFSGLTTFTGDSFYANTGGVLNLPTVTSYTGPSTFN